MNGKKANKKHEPDAESMMQQMLDGMRAHTRRAEIQSEKRIWRSVQLPCSLEDALNSLTKYELDKIRQNLGIANVSALKKAALAEVLAKGIELFFEMLLMDLDQKRLDLIEDIVAHSGVMPVEWIPRETAEAWLRSGILFTGSHNGTKVLFLPVELVRAYGKIDKNKVKTAVTRNDEWLRLVHGMVYWYGVVSKTNLPQEIRDLTGKAVDRTELTRVIESDISFYGVLHESGYGYVLNDAANIEKLVIAQREWFELPHYPFSKVELLEAGVPGYYERVPELDVFLELLDYYYDIPQEKLDEIVQNLNKHMRGSLEPEAALKYLESFFEIPAPVVLEALTAAVAALQKGTRSWVLKGHRPKDVIKEEVPLVTARAVKRPSAEAFEKHLQKAPVERVKIGRNDPCPCGSGKKFKKCCGK